MTEPQVWVLMGLFASAIFGMLTWQTITFTRTLRTSIDGLREGVDLRFGMFEAKVDARFAMSEAKIDARFATVEAKIDNLDRDVQALARHVFGADPR